MARTMEIATYVIASALALGGGFIGAELMLGGADTPAEAKPVAVVERTAPPPNTAELRSERYGFSFRYPQNWGQGPRYHSSVRESVGRRDGVFCYVSTFDKPVPSDEDGTPNDLRRHMSGLKPSDFEKFAVMGAKMKVESFERATLGGQDARSFTVNVTAGEGASMRQGKLIGYATLRHFGAIFLICVAPDCLHADPGVQADFRAAFTTFKFIPR